MCVDVDDERHDGGRLDSIPTKERDRERKRESGRRGTILELKVREVEGCIMRGISSPTRTTPKVAAPNVITKRPYRDNTIFYLCSYLQPIFLVPRNKLGAELGRNCDIDPGLR